MSKIVFLMNELQFYILTILSQTKGVYLVAQEIEKKLPKKFVRPENGRLCGASLMHMRKKGWVRQNKLKEWYITSGAKGKGTKALGNAKRNPDKVEPYDKAKRRRRGLKDARQTPPNLPPNQMGVHASSKLREQTQEIGALKEALGLATRKRPGGRHEVTLKFEGFEIIVRPV